MKSLAIVVIAFALSAYAQVPPPHAPTAHTPAGVPTPQPAATTVEPKPSIATANLRAAEAEKATLLSQQQALVQQVNALMGGIRDKIAAKEKEAAEQEEEIRKENGWGADYAYTPPQPLQDGSTSPGKWQKVPPAKK